MAAMTSQSTVSEQAEYESATCDRCGGAARAQAVLKLAHLRLFLCGHCTGVHGPTAMSKGWRILFLGASL